MENEMTLQDDFQALISRPSSGKENRSQDYRWTEHRPEENNRKTGRRVMMASMVLIITLLISVVTVTTIYFQAKNYLSDVKQETLELIVALHENTSTHMLKPDAKDFQVKNYLSYVKQQTLELIVALHANTSTLMLKEDAKDLKTQNYLKDISNAVTQMQDLLKAETSSSESVEDLPGFQILKNIELTQVAVRMLKLKEENSRELLRAMKMELGLQILKNLNVCPMLQNPDGNAPEALAEIQEELEDAASRLKTGWKRNGRNIYYFSSAIKSWTDAEEFCVSQDSHLASITTLEEQNFIKRTKGEYEVWLGLTDEGSEGEWRFVDGSKYGEPLFWSRENPDNWKGNEHCAAITSGSDWNDLDCALIEKWICKMPIL